jgi:hypothetical protein
MYGELRARAARHEAIAHDALARLDESEARARKQRRELGSMRQRVAELEATLTQRRERTASAVHAYPGNSKTIEVVFPANARSGLMRSEKSLQLIGIDWFGAVMIETRGCGAAFVVLLSPARQGNQGHLRAPRFEANAFGDLIAA